MADIQDSISATVGNIYQAAIDQDCWLGAVQSLQDLFDGSRACILRWSGASVDALSTVFDPELNSAAAANAFLEEPVTMAALSAPLGVAYEFSALGNNTAFRRSEVWREWFKPRDLHSALAGKLLTSGDATWFLHVHRGSGQRPYTANDLALLQKLMPHLVRAGEISKHLEKTRVLASAFADMPFGMIVVNADHQLMHMNETADAMLSRPGCALSLRSGRFAAADPRDMRELGRLLDDACAYRDGVMPGTGGAMLLASHTVDAGAGRLMLSVAPFPNVRAYGMPVERCAMIMITNVARQATNGFEAHLRSLFGLTAAEARLADALAAGLSMAEMAAEANITLKSCRTYLTRVFDKTGTHRQSELVALLRTVQPIALRRTPSRMD